MPLQHHLTTDIVTQLVVVSVASGSHDDVFITVWGLFN